MAVKGGLQQTATINVLIIVLQHCLEHLVMFMTAAVNPPDLPA